MPRRRITAVERRSFSMERGRLEAQLKVKEKAHDFSEKSLLMSVREHIGKLIDNASLRDWVYVVSFLSAVYMVYKILSKTEIAFVDFITGIWGPAGILGAVFWKIFPGPVEEIKAIINETLLVQSIVIAYGMLKIDLSDVTSVTAKLGSLISSLAVVA